MKNVLIEKDCKYAQDKPSLPILDFVKDKTYPLEDYLADSIIKNGDGNEIEPESKDESKDEVASTVEPETKEKPRKANSSKKNKG